MFTIDIDIDRPPDEVFARLEAVEETPRWYSAVEAVERLTPVPLAVGSRYRFSRQLPGGRAVNEVEVTEHVPNEVFTLASRSGPTPFTYRYRLAPMPAAARASVLRARSAARVSAARCRSSPRSPRASSRAACGPISGPSRRCSKPRERGGILPPLILARSRPRPRSGAGIQLLKVAFVRTWVPACAGTCGLGLSQSASGRSRSPSSGNARLDKNRRDRELSPAR